MFSQKSSILCAHKLQCIVPMNIYNAPKSRQAINDFNYFCLIKPTVNPILGGLVKPPNRICLKDSRKICAVKKKSGKS